jgi:hypothetical protein
LTYEHIDRVFAELNPRPFRKRSRMDWWEVIISFVTAIQLDGLKRLDSIPTLLGRRRVPIVVEEPWAVARCPSSTRRTTAPLVLRGTIRIDMYRLHVWNEPARP